MVEIRKGEARDKDDYLRVQFAVFPGEITQRKRHEQYFDLKITRDEILVLIQGDEYIGHFTFSRMISPPFPGSIYLEEIAILQDYQGKGHGTRAMNEIITMGKKEGFHQVWLDTWASTRNRALKFYKKFGFEKRGTVTKDGFKEYFLCLDF
nr:GNAT family N-acetyltransferase [Candidatus Sigynarchaeota archaeon]